MSELKERTWQEALYASLRENGVDLFVHVPDGGHGKLIELATLDPDVEAIALTNEIEGVPILAGYHLGGRRGVLLMQSSGVGNCVNQFSLIEIGRFPFLTIVTMRGDFGEQNAWQFPMGQAVEPVMHAMNIRTVKVVEPSGVVAAATAGVNMAFRGKQGVAVLLGQALLGAKSF